MKSLKELEGTTVAMLSPTLHVTAFQRVKLHKVEDAGVWIESQTVTERILKGLGASMSPKTGIFFLPWTSVTMIMSSLDDVPSISDSML